MQESLLLISPNTPDTRTLSEQPGVGSTVRSGGRDCQILRPRVSLVSLSRWESHILGRVLSSRSLCSLASARQDLGYSLRRTPRPERPEDRSVGGARSRPGTLLAPACVLRELHCERFSETRDHQ